MSTIATEHSGTTIMTRDGTEIFYKDWGMGQPVVFSHGWPLNADAWDDQLFFMGSNGFRAVAHARRARPPRPRSLKPAVGRQRHGPLRRRPRRGHRSARSARRGPGRPLHGR